MTYGIGPKRRRRTDPAPGPAEDDWLAGYRPSSDDSDDGFPMRRRRRSGDDEPTGSFNGFDTGDDSYHDPSPTGAFSPLPGPRPEPRSGPGQFSDAIAPPLDEPTGSFGAASTYAPPPQSTGYQSGEFAAQAVPPPEPEPHPTAHFAAAQAAAEVPVSPAPGPARRPPVSPHPDEEPIFRRFDPSTPPSVPPTTPAEEPILKYMQPRDRTTTRSTYGGRRRAPGARPVSGPAAPVPSGPPAAGDRRHRYRDDEAPAYAEQPAMPSLGFPEQPPARLQLPAGYDRPGYDRPGHDQPQYDQPQYDQPGGYQQPGYDQPGYDQPGYDQAAYAQPPTGNGFAGQPGFGAQPGFRAAPGTAGYPLPAGAAPSNGSAPPYESQPYESQPYESQPYESQPYESQPYEPPAFEPFAPQSRALPALPSRRHPDESENLGPKPAQADAMRIVTPDTTGGLPRMSSTTSGSLPRISDRSDTGGLPRVGSGNTGGIPRITSNTGNLRPVRIDPMRPGDGSNPSSWMKALAALGVVVLLAVCGLSTYFVFQDETGSSGGDPGDGGAPVAEGPEVRDITSQAADPAPLTEAEVFPADLVTGQNGLQYQVLKKEGKADCTGAATDQLAQLMVTNGCTQVVRGTLKSSDGTYLITAGVFNLKDEASAINAHENIKPTIDAQKGRFNGMLAGAGTEVLLRAPMILGWHARGHFLAYCVIARVDGAGFGEADQVPTQIQTDILTTHLRDAVIGGRTVSDGAARPAASPSGS